MVRPPYGFLVDFKLPFMLFDLSTKGQITFKTPLGFLDLSVKGHKFQVTSWVP